MTEKNSVVAIFESQIEAEVAVKALEQSGFDMTKVSIAGRGSSDDELGVYHAGDRIKHWAKVGAFWGWILGLFFGSALFWVPGFGPLVIAGRMVGFSVAALEGAVAMGALSAIAAGLYSMGIPKEHVERYVDALKADKLLLVVHGTPDEAARAHEIIGRTHTGTLDHHT